MDALELGSSQPARLQEEIGANPIPFSGQTLIGDTDTANENAAGLRCRRWPRPRMLRLHLRAPAISLSDFVTGDLDREDRSKQMALSVRMHCCRDVGEHAGIRAAAAKETQHPCHHG